MTKKDYNNNKKRNRIIFSTIFSLIILIELSYLLFARFQKKFMFFETKQTHYQLTVVPPGISYLSEMNASLSSDGENFLSPPSQFNKEIFFNGPTEKKRIALTFDADMTPGMQYYLRSGRVKSYFDQKLVDYLIKTQTKATFFLTGLWIDEYPDVTTTLATNPLFELGNHSYSHVSFNGFCYGLQQIPDSQDQEEIQRTQLLLKNIAHIDNKLFRFPGGCYSQSDLDIVKKAGLRAIQWDVAGRDGFNNDQAGIENNVLSNVKNGSIIILHMNGFPNEPKTAESLLTIIPKLKENGFEFVTVSDLLNNQEKTSAMNTKTFIKDRYPL